jgi:NAD(P)-dependent dehydrogenase (short-subunit alcohol dehydrogenase family)
MKPLSEQVVVIFGASSGIGRLSALRFAERGARLVVAARSVDGLDTLVDEIADKGGQAIAAVADTADYSEVQAVAQRAVTEFGALDTWVHTAAVSVYGYSWDIPPEEFKRVIEVDLLGQVYGALAALPHMRERGGTLIHISSVIGRRAFPLQSPYSAAKQGLNGFTEALRVELRQAGVPVRVTTIMPASINTPFFNNARSRMGVKPMAMPPVYEPQLVVDAILYAAEHPARDIFVGGAGYAVSIAQRISPQLLDRVLERVGSKLQQTDEPESSNSPHNLYQPVEVYNRVEGDFGHMSRGMSVGTWLETHPGIRNLLRSAAIVGACTLAARALRRG